MSRKDRNKLTIITQCSKLSITKSSPKAINCPHIKDDSPHLTTKAYRLTPIHHEINTMLKVITLHQENPPLQSKFVDFSDFRFHLKNL